MKKTDIAMIVLIASLSIIAAFFITRAILGDSTQTERSVKTIDPITAEVAEPDPKIFNENAINPAVEVQVGASQ
ncbi:hypothetical protein B7Y94_00285 [Candidatus Saccharibacteria bacterium 32-49-12]|nr:MAG: hypothetical protein B7Y94_00285 [Candidatus Saccharibacteria bacterium 32-49-12]